VRAIEFEANIENGVIHIPKDHGITDISHARVIVLTKEKRAPVSVFDPTEFFGASKQTKKAIDSYLQEDREGWG
jgi:hypothetical protein